MPNIATALRDEILRLARKEVKALVGPIRKHSAEHRRAIAELKRKVASLERKTAFLEKQEGRRLGKAPKASDAAGVRFSPKWLKADRQRVGLSAKNYGLLVGVSGLTIYNWERGKTRPSEKALAGWAKVRGIGKREAVRRLELLSG